MIPERLRAALQLGLFALLLLTPLPFGSVQAGPVLAIEFTAAALGLITIVLIGRDQQAAAAVPRAPLAICAGVIALGIFQIIPLPYGIAAKFNPTADLVRPLIPYLGLDHPPTVTWSIASPETIDALLRFIAYVLIGLAAAVAFDTERSRRRFAVVLVATAVIQAVYGSGEYLTGRQHIFGFAKKYYLDSATGTLINRNHFATLLAIGLPFALTLAIPRSSERPVHGWRERLVALSKGRALLRLCAVAAAALIWMGLLLSHSRAGLAVGIAAAMIVIVHFRATRAARWVMVIGTGVLLLLFTLEMAQAPGERFFAVKDDLGAKAGRLAVWRDTLTLVKNRPVLGTGLGTFEQAFAAVQSPDIHAHYDHAHNDWIEWVADGGSLALLGAVSILAIALLRRRLPPGVVGLAATRAAIIAVALHALFDFSLRIPSIAVTVAIIVGFGMCHSGAQQPGPFRATSQ